MNRFFRIMVGIFSAISIVIWGVVLVSPFGDKQIMAEILDFINVTFYQSNQYDIAIFIGGLVLFIVSIVLLTSAVRSAKASKYICKDGENGTVKISSTAIENIALSYANRFQGVKESKARAVFVKDQVVISVKLVVFPDVNVPNLCKGIQDRIKDAVEVSMDVPVKDISINVDNVHSQTEE